MSHATDGQLEAHLDGALASFDRVGSDRLIAHLAACADCRRRLEAARATRERAGEILAGVLVSPVEVPPFEEIRARAGRSGAESQTAGASGRRGGRRLAPAPLAWAASVAIAVGAGWMGHAVWSGGAAPAPLANAPGPSLESRVGRIDAADRGAFRAAPAAETAESATEGAIAADEVAASEAGAFEDAPERLRSVDAAGPTPTPGADPGAAGARARAEQDRAAALAAPAERAETPAATPEALPAPAGTPPAEGEDPARDRRENRPLAAARLAEPDPVAARELQQSAAKQEPPGARQDAAPFAPDATVEVADDSAAAAGRDRPGETRWSEVERPLAERWSGGRLLQVEGLPVEDYAITLREGVELVRVGQSLPGGERLELVYAASSSEANEALAAAPARPAPAEEAMEAAETPPAPAGSLTLRVAGVRVTISAPVAADSLRVLGSRIR